jgi:hypothetical protein
VGALLLLILAFAAGALAVVVVVCIDPSSRRRARRALAAPPTPRRVLALARAGFRRLVHRGGAHHAFWRRHVAPRWHDAGTWCRALPRRVAARARSVTSSAAARQGAPSLDVEDPSSTRGQQVA